MANYFESKTSVQAMRYEFFYGVNSKQLPSESPAQWARRLNEKAEICDFEQMTQEDALALVMSRYGKIEVNSRKRKSLLNDTNSSTKKFRDNNEDLVLEDHDQESNIGEHLQVELDWGQDESELSTDMDIKKEEISVPTLQPPAPTATERVTSDDVIIPKGQPCNCPNCQASPSGKALR